MFTVGEHSKLSEKNTIFPSISKIIIFLLPEIFGSLPYTTRMLGTLQYHYRKYSEH